MKVPKALLYISTQNLHSLCPQLDSKELAQSSTRKIKIVKFLIYLSRKFRFILLNFWNRWMVVNWARCRDSYAGIKSLR